MIDSDCDCQQHAGSHEPDCKVFGQSPEERIECRNSEMTRDEYIAKEIESVEELIRTAFRRLDELEYVQRTLLFVKNHGYFLGPLRCHSLLNLCRSILGEHHE